MRFWIRSSVAVSIGYLKRGTSQLGDLFPDASLFNCWTLCVPCRVLQDLLDDDDDDGPSHDVKKAATTISTFCSGGGLEAEAMSHRLPPRRK